MQTTEETYSRNRSEEMNNVQFSREIHVSHFFKGFLL